MRERQQIFTDTFAWSNVSFNLTAGGEARNAQGLWVSGGFFNGLGVAAPLLFDLTAHAGAPGSRLAAGDGRTGGDPHPTSCIEPTFE